MWPEAGEQGAMLAAESDEDVLEVTEVGTINHFRQFLVYGDHIDSGDPINAGSPGAPASHTKEQVLKFSPYTPGSYGCDACNRKETQRIGCCSFRPASNFHFCCSDRFLHVLLRGPLSCMREKGVDSAQLWVPSQEAWRVAPAAATLRYEDLIILLCQPLHCRIHLFCLAIKCLLLKKINMSYHSKTVTTDFFF